MPEQPTCPYCTSRLSTWLGAVRAETKDAQGVRIATVTTSRHRCLACGKTYTRTPPAP